MFALLNGGAFAGRAVVEAILFADLEFNASVFWGGEGSCIFMNGGMCLSVSLGGGAVWYTR